MVETANTIWRDYVTDGVPSSTKNNPKKSEIRTWGTWIEGIITAFTANGGLIYSSKAALYADLAHAANTMAWVLGDATVANNGVYQKQGASGAGSWTRVADLPFSFIIASDTGAGTPNAIQATTSIPVSSSALIWMNIFEANTASPVTVSFNGGSAVAIKTNSGNDVAAGSLTAGMIVLGIVSGTTFRLVSDQASAAVLAACEAARDQAVAAASSVQSEQASRAHAIANYHPISAPDFIRVAGYAASGDGGAALYKKVSAEPAHAGKMSITLDDAVTVVWYEIAERTVTPLMLGAEADGANDDTSAINDAFGTPALHIHIPMGSFRITDPLQDGTPVLQSNLDGRVITCDGALTATSTVLVAVGIYGANSNVQINVDGNDQIAEGLRIFADGCVVNGCRIVDLYTTTYSAVAIGTINVNGGIIIRNNIIKNLESVGDGVLGNGNGLSRGITLSMNADATAESLIEENYIENIVGQEGDAIVAISMDGGGVFRNARTTIRDNTVKNFNRRGVKIQANRCRVIDNYFTHNFSSSAEVPNAITVIDFVQGGDNQAINNTLDGCKWFNQINVFATAPESFSNFFIEDNKVLGLAAETTGTVISVVPLGSNVFIRGNLLSCGTGRAISLGDIDRCVVEDNTIFACADAASQRVISLASTVTKAIVKGNILLNGSRQCFIGLDASNAVVVDNHVKCDTPLIRETAGGKNALILGNSIDGTASVSSGTTPTGDRFGGNYKFGNQIDPWPGILFTSHASGPSVDLVGKYVSAGQIVFDTTPAAGGKIGWVATTSGLAESVTWKQFGAIDA